MSETDKNTENLLQESVGEPVTGPGARLRAARERKGLDVKAVADHLHLHERLIEALERDDYSGLPSAVFVKGYLRNYARLVDEPVNEVVSLAGGLQASESSYSPSFRGAQIQSRIKPYRKGGSASVAGTLLWLLVLAAVVFAILWWRGYIELPSSLSDRLSGSNEESAEMLLQPAGAGADANGNLPLEGSVDDRVSVPESPAGADTIQVPPPVLQQDEPITQTDTASAQPQLPTAVVEAPEQPAAIEAAPTEPVQGEAVPEDTPPVGDARSDVTTGVEGTGEGVVFQFTAPCWVDVRDAEGNKVLYGGVGSGERHVLTGIPPYRVVLGNNAAVSISVDGRPFDTSAHSSGRVARFNLDPADPYSGVTE